MAGENNSIQALISAGNDAFANMYDVKLEFADWNATVRATGFQIPEVSVETYPMKYHGVSYARVKPEQTFERKFSLEFRLDAKWGLYKAFTSLLSWHVNPNNGGVSNTNVDKVGDVVVRTIDSGFVAAGESDAGEIGKGVEYYSSDSPDTLGQIDPNPEMKWTFHNCCVVKVGQPNFSTEGSDALKFTVDFIFGDCEYPGFKASESK